MCKASTTLAHTCLFCSLEALNISLNVFCNSEHFFFLLDDVFHNLGKEDHRQPTPPTPRNGSTGLASLPPLSGPPLPPAPTTHLPTIGSQPFPKIATPAPDFADSHQGLCLPPAEPPANSLDGPVSAPPSVCRQVC